MPPTESNESASSRCLMSESLKPDISDRVMCEQFVGVIATFGDTVYEAFAELQDFGRTAHILLSRRVEKSRLHFRRHRMCIRSKTGHNRQPHCHIRRRHKHRSTDNSPRTFQGFLKGHVQCAFTTGKSVKFEIVDSGESGCSKHLPQFFARDRQRIGWFAHRTSLLSLLESWTESKPASS